MVKIDINEEDYIFDDITPSSLFNEEDSIFNNAISLYKINNLNIKDYTSDIDPQNYSYNLYIKKNIYDKLNMKYASFHNHKFIGFWYGYSCA